MVRFTQGLQGDQVVRIMDCMGVILKNPCSIDIGDIGHKNWKGGGCLRVMARQPHMMQQHAEDFPEIDNIAPHFWLLVAILTQVSTFGRS